LSKTYVCGYAHCLHKNEKVIDVDSVVVGKRRFHKDCAEIRNHIEILKKLYFDYVENPKYVEVVGVINNIVFKKGVNPKYMIFALKYIINKNVRIKSPYFLHYLPKNNTILKLWKKEQEDAEIDCR
jgi:hypothetical protein